MNWQDFVEMLELYALESEARAYSTSEKEYETGCADTYREVANMIRRLCNFD